MNPTKQVNQNTNQNPDQGKLLQTDASPEISFKAVNKSFARLDGYEKVTGRVAFGADISKYRQIYAVNVLSPLAHAKIMQIDLSQAMKVPGFTAAATAADVPGSNSMFGRFPVLAAEEVKFIGDGVAVIAAETREAAVLAASLVKVTYRELPAVLTVKEALAPEAPRVHPDLEDNHIEHSHHKMYSGNVETGFSQADIILERDYTTGFAYTGYIEPEAVAVYPDPGRNGIVIEGTIQNPYSVRENVAAALGVPMNHVRVIQTAIGGSFGGKDESVIVMAARCAVLAAKTRRPVKMVLSREESSRIGGKRHPYFSHYRIGATRDGTITAIEDTVYAQGGAYNKQAMFLNWRGSVHAAGPYRIPHVKTDIYGVYTHTLYGTAYRGFSAPQLVFAVESLIDELAEACRLDPLEFRLRNCLKPGDTIPSGQTLDPEKMPANLREILLAVTDKTGFKKKWQENRIRAIQPGHQNLKQLTPQQLSGIGLSATYRGAGLGGEGLDTGAAVLTLDRDGYLNIQSSSTEMGQGIRTAHAQIAAEVLGISMDRVSFSPTDTSITLDAGPTVASRGILSGGNAVKIAAEKIRARLASAAVEILGCTRNPHPSRNGGKEALEFSNDTVYLSACPENSISLTELAMECHRNRGIPLTAQGWFTPEPEKLDHATGQGNAYPTYLFGAAVAEITLDPGTGKISVKKITAAYELGRAVNPDIVIGQLTGSIMQGLGYGIMEEIDVRSGALQTLNFDEYMLPGVMDLPEVDILLYETDSNVGPYGAKGIGEIGIELIAPAIANAFFNATGRRIRELPLNFERALLGKALR